MESGRQAHGAFGTADETFVNAWQATLPELRRRALRLAGGRRDRAEDLIGDTAIKALLFMRGSPDSLTDPAGLLMVVLRHVFLDGVRRGRREGATVDVAADVQAALETRDGGGLSPLQHAELRDQMNRVVAVVAALTREQKRLFALRFVEDLPYVAISERLHISEPLTRKRVELLRRRLRTADARD